MDEVKFITISRDEFRQKVVKALENNKLLKETISSSPMMGLGFSMVVMETTQLLEKDLFGFEETDIHEEEIL